MDYFTLAQDITRQHVKEMGAMRYVQHKSGQGEKWEVRNEGSDIWYGYNGKYSVSLPKSEYVSVPPPEVWRDVTADCQVLVDLSGIVHAGKMIFSRGSDAGNYRLRRVATAFIIEKLEESDAQ